MADVGVPWTLTTPAVVIPFNDGSLDQFYITRIRGLAMPPIRAPVDPVPLGDGGLVHDFWKGPLHIGIEGLFLIQSTRVMDSIVIIRNDMEADLVDALESILRADGTFAGAPQGHSTRTYTVNCEIPLDTDHADNYLSYTFSFGLVAGDPNWAGSS
jgi:hypothetical protein